MKRLEHTFLQDYYSGRVESVHIFCIFIINLEYFPIPAIVDNSVKEIARY